MILALRDLIVTELQGGESPLDGMECTIAAALLPRYTKKDVSELKVNVVPASIDKAEFERAADMRNNGLFVGLTKHLSEGQGDSSSDQEDLTEADSLVMLVESLIDWFSPTDETYFTAGDWVCMSAKAVPLYSFNHLEDHRTFHSVIQLQFEHRG